MPPIAKRSFQLTDPGGQPGRVVAVEFAKPQRDSETGSFKCFYRVTGISSAGLRYGAGTDAVQALLLAMVNAASLLYTSHEWKDGRITLNGSRNLDLPAIASVFAEGVPGQALQLVV